jgi:hypothetical protein
MNIVNVMIFLNQKARHTSQKDYVLLAKLGAAITEQVGHGVYMFMTTCCLH